MSESREREEEEGQNIAGETMISDMRMWKLETSDTEYRARWRSLIELGAAQKPVTQKD